MYLVYVARRDDVPPWAFWRARAALVYAWVNLASAEEAERKAREDIARKGWTVVRLQYKCPIAENETLRRGWIRKYWIRTATKYGCWYNVVRISVEEIDPPPRDTPVLVTSRYAKVADLRIDPVKLPDDLRALIPFAEEWAIGDDVERMEYIRNAPVEKKKAFVDAVYPHMDAIDAYCSPRRDQTPVPDEAVLFDMMAEAVEEAKLDLGEQ